MELDYKARLKIFGFDVALVVIILGGFLLGINYYNKTTGAYCEESAQCQLSCPAGAFNDNFINIYFGPFGDVECTDAMTAVCQNNRCEEFSILDARTPYDCDRVAEGILKIQCFFTLAKNTSDAGICDLIYLEPDASHCHLEMALRLDDLAPCGKIKDARLREACVGAFIETPPGYAKQETYAGDCNKKPSSSVCLNFGDGFTWLVFDSILRNETSVLEGRKIEIARGEKADYYHMLYTDFVKEVQKSA